jgi:hypothetical protein
MNIFISLLKQEYKYNAKLFLYHIIRGQIKQNYTYSNRHVGMSRENDHSEQLTAMVSSTNLGFIYETS